MKTLHKIGLGVGSWALSSLLFPAVVLGQTADVPAQQIRNLANDLAGLQELIGSAQQEYQNALMAHALKFKNVGSVTITSKFATARAGAADDAASIYRPEMGAKLSVIDKANGWYAVEFPTTVTGYKSGWIRAADVVPQASTVQDVMPSFWRPSFGGSAISEALFRALTERVEELRKKYRDNPYFHITGFSVNVGLPPSVSVSFEFKE